MAQRSSDGDPDLSRLSVLLKDRVRGLVDVIETRTNCREELEAADRFLTQMQDELKRINRPIGYKPSDAAKILEQFEVSSGRGESWACIIERGVRPEAKEIFTPGGKKG